jgi:hypothetical protein
VGVTEAEDRIYALLGLAENENDEIVRETVEGMEIGNVRRTYTKFAASVLKRNPDVLLFSQRPKSLANGHDLPSWVPDWSSERVQAPYGYSDTMTPVFSAGGGQVSDDVVFEVSTSALRVTAVPVGHVIRVGMYGIQPDQSATLKNVDYVSIRHFFDEIDEFMERATRIDPEKAPDTSDEQKRLESMVRLSDGGFSVRHFPDEFNKATAQAVLQELHKKASNWGKHLIEVEDNYQAWTSVTGIIRSIQNKPWHWIPASEIDVVRLCAVDPVAAARTWITGSFLTITDVVIATYYAMKVRLLVGVNRFRIRRANTEFQSPTDRAALTTTVMSTMGLTDVIRTREWEHYTSSLFKNIGRKVFLTDTGYVGLGPSHMKVNDTVIVIPGGSVPYLLRPQASSDRGDSSQAMQTWSYVGEAYCDGIMDGEVFKEKDIKTQSFSLV